MITPGEISYSFRLLFEEREISIMAYNLETLLAEKIETVLSRGTVNTRMRDFYDIYGSHCKPKRIVSARRRISVISVKSVNSRSFLLILSVYRFLRSFSNAVKLRSYVFSAAALKKQAGNSPLHT